MKKNLYDGKNNSNTTKVQTNHHQTSSSNRLLPNSLKFISSCIKTASSGVRSAGATFAASISADPHDSRDQVLCACFDRVELGPSSFKHVLLLGYANGFQVLDVEDSSEVREIVSKRDDPVTCLQMQPLPKISDGPEGFRSSHPLLMAVACEDSKNSGMTQNGRDGIINGYTEAHTGNPAMSPRVVRFYSLKSHNYVHVLRFRSTVFMVRCSSQIVAVGLASQIHCFDAVSLESKFSVLTYPVPQLGVQGGLVGVNVGYGPMAVGPRWLAYASNNPLLSNTGRLSPQSLTPPGVSPSTSPSSGNLARYAMESSKQLASGILNLGDMGFKTFTKYCQPDGSSPPVSSNSGWKVGRVGSHSPDTDIAGMVIIKDIISRAVVSQFRAHASPISSLSFDPSGTLLVTASVHGKNINIFRIMPSCSRNGSSNQSYDVNSSHVHLYKFHRGMTPAVIQDICFSQYSQWIAIITLNGTCHVFTLSPFGGDTTHKQSSHVDGPSHLPVPSVPWWFTPYFRTNQQTFSSPPPPVTLSVVSRIKDNSGWLNTVTSAASSAAEKVSIPSGARSAVFHSSVAHDLQTSHLKVTALEHLLVYTPSGHAVQYKLLPRVGLEPGEATSRIAPGSSIQTHEEELRVKVEHIQWWDVCRRTTWPEREECVSGMELERQEDEERVMDTFDCDVGDTGEKELVKPLERTHLYIANAEVQINSGRVPIWQKSKIYFYTMSSKGASERNFTEDLAGGEIEIEKVPVYEVEVRRKDLLPVSDQFHRLLSNWSDRDVSGRGSSSPSSDSLEAKETLENVGFSADKLASTGNLDSGDSYPSIFLSGNVNNGERGGKSFPASPLLNQSFLKNNSVSISCRQPTSGDSLVGDGIFPKSSSTLRGGSLAAESAIAKEVPSVNNGGSSESSNVSSDRSDLSMNIIDEGPVHDSLDFEQFFQEGYCNPSPLSNFPESTEVVTDADSSSSPCDREKCEEDGDNDDMLGGVFDFSEEG